MAKDAEIIQKAYEESVSKAFDTFFSDYVTANDEAGREASRTRFINGMKMRHIVRKLAIDSLPAA